MSEIATPTVNRPGTRILKTKARDVLVVGTELVSARFLDVVKYVIDFIADGEDHGVNSIILSDLDVPITLDSDEKSGYTQVMADACMHAGAITINLEQTMQRCIEAVLEADTFSLYGVWWHNMIVNVIHEILHCADFIQDAKPQHWLANYLLNKEGFADQMEKEVEKTADAIMKSLAQQVDIEPPVWGEEPYFAGQAMELYSGEDGASQTAIRWLNDRVFIYTCDPDTKDPAPICDFRGYMQAMSGDPADDDNWSAKLLVIDGDVAAAGEKLANGFQAAVEQTQNAAEEAVMETAVQDPDAMDVMDVEYDELDEGPAGVEDSVEGVMFGAAQGGFMGAFGMADASPMPSIPTSAAPTPPPQQAPATQTPLADEVAGSFGFGPNGASTAPTTNVGPAPQPAAAPQYQPAASPQVQNLSNLGLDPDEVRRRFFSVASKIYNHVFTACEPRGGSLEAEWVKGFDNPDAVTKQPIMLTAEESQVVVACDGMDDMGRWMRQRPTNDGKVFGMVTSKQGIPMYKLYINFNGHQLCRILLPQNPNIRNDANYLKTTAQAARSGQAIMYIREGDDAVKAANPAASLKAKRVNNGPWELINK